MIVTFYDRQNAQNPANGRSFAADEDVFDLIESAAAEGASFCELQGENGFNLLIGAARPLACAQYSRDDGQPPYWMATLPQTKDKEGFVDFLIADTATPVSARYCLPLDFVKNVILYFQETGLRNLTVDWEAI